LTDPPTYKNLTAAIEGALKKSKKKQVTKV
jgi:hypothetical protein